MQPYYEDGKAGITLYHGDCLEVMAGFDAGMFDANITDVPYGTTACAWDTPIPFEPMWANLKRVCKPHAAHALFGSEPFSSLLRASNLAWFKYDWIWDKAQSGSFQNAKYEPLQITEDIMVFGNGAINYYPQMITGKLRTKGGAKVPLRTASGILTTPLTISDQYHPTTIIAIPNCANKAGRIHPTQKPLALIEYLVRTYTNEGDLVLDFTSGSGTTLRACKNLKRRAVGIEMKLQYCEATVHRLEPEFEAALVDDGASLEDLPLFAV